MKPLLFALLAASVVANVALLVSRSRQPVAPAAANLSPATAPTGKDSATATVPTGQAARPGAGNASAPSDHSAHAGAPVPMAWHAANSDQDLHRVVAGLRAAGYPASVIRAVINQLLNERYTQRSPLAGQPFWKRTGPPTPETMAAQTALNNERQALFDTLLGPDARPSATMDQDAKERRYGNMPDDKIDAIARIERDYNEMSSEAYARRRGNTVVTAETMMQTQQLMEKEKLADLASVLTPDELTQYEMRNSTAARTLINNLRNVEVSEAEYIRLYQAQKAFEAANPRQFNMNGASFTQRQAAQLALNEEARAVLGDARFYPYLEGADNMYANVARSLNKYPSVTPAAAYQVYQLQTEFQGQMMMQGTRSGQPPTQDQMDGMRSLAGSYSAKLDSVLGHEVAEAYRTQGPGRIFSPGRQVPRVVMPLSPGTPVTPTTPVTR